MKKLIVFIALFTALFAANAFSADGKRNIGAACLPEYSRDGEYIARLKGGKLANVNKDKTYRLSVVCPILNDVIKETKIKTDVYYKGDVDCTLWGYSKKGENAVYADDDLVNDSKIRRMTMEIYEENGGNLELYCHIGGGSELISYGWTEDPS